MSGLAVANRSTARAITYDHELLGQCGIDHCLANENDLKARGPGIGKYFELDGEWRPASATTHPLRLRPNRSGRWRPGARLTP